LPQHAQRITYTQVRIAFTRPASRATSSSLTLSSTHMFLKLTAPGLKEGDTATSVDDCE
jgi:hypothetical protein